MQLVNLGVPVYVMSQCGILIGLTNTMQRANINIQRGATDRRSAQS